MRHEILRGDFGGFHAGRLEIGGAHAARNVEGQDDRADHARDADHGLRTGQRDDQDGQRQQEESRGDMTAYAKPASLRRLYQPQLAVTRGGPPSPDG